MPSSKGCGGRTGVPPAALLEPSATGAKDGMMRSRIAVVVVALVPTVSAQELSTNLELLASVESAGVPSITRRVKGAERQPESINHHPALPAT